MLGLHIWFVQATSKGTWSNWEGRERREEEGRGREEENERGLSN